MGWWGMREGSGDPGRVGKVPTAKYTVEPETELTLTLAMYANLAAAACTVSVALAVKPETVSVAVMVDVPVATPRAIAVTGSMVATVAVPELQVTTVPVGSG